MLLQRPRYLEEAEEEIEGEEIDEDGEGPWTLTVEAWKDGTSPRQQQQQQNRSRVVVKRLRAPGGDTGAVLALLDELKPTADAATVRITLRALRPSPPLLAYALATAAEGEAVTLDFHTGALVLPRLQPPKLEQLALRLGGGVRGGSAARRGRGGGVGFVVPGDEDLFFSSSLAGRGKGKGGVVVVGMEVDEEEDDPASLGAPAIGRSHSALPRLERGLGGDGKVVDAAEEGEGEGGKNKGAAAAVSSLLKAGATKWRKRRPPPLDLNGIGPEEEQAPVAPAPLKGGERSESAGYGGLPLLPRHVPIRETRRIVQAWGGMF